MNRRYAANTSVTPAQSRNEIETLLERAGADQFGYVTSTDHTEIRFRLEGRYYRIGLLFPQPDEDRFWLTPQTRVKRSHASARDAYEQEKRRLWRSLALYLKARLTAAADGIVTIEQAFLADVLLLRADGTAETLAERVLPQIAWAYASGEQVPLLADPGAAAQSRQK